MTRRAAARDCLADEPLRLAEAAAIAFPDGSMTASGLRRERDRGRLAVFQIAGKDYTTLAAIRDMIQLCRVQPSRSASCSTGQKEAPAPSGISMTARPGDVFRASFHAGAGRSYIDLEAGVFYRLPEGKRETAKRQTPVRLGTRLLGHLRRWKRHCVSYPVEWEGLPVQSVDTSFARAVELAGLGDGVSMYSLRHSRLTNIIQRGCTKEEAAEHGATSVDVIEKHYWHHSPEAQKKAANSR